jgi:hypothetical protein
MKEQELVVKVVNYFSEWFYIKTEIFDDTKKYRIDLVLKCKTTGAVFGIECKKPDIKRGKSAGDIVTQAMRYSLCKFDGKRIPIFICPQLSKTHFIAPIKKIHLIDNDSKLLFKNILNQNDINENNLNHFYIDRHNSEDSKDHTFNGFICSFNVGEIRSRYKEDLNTYYNFTFCNQVIYSTEKYNNQIFGLHKENYNKLISKIEKYDLFQ